MAAWEYKVNIKQYLNREGEDDIVTIAENIAKELGNVPPWIFRNLPAKLVDETRTAVEKMPDDKDYHELKFNKVLDRIYDAADDYRVWLGLM
jgi:hypothetical protein